MRRNVRGYTLVEVMVAIAVLSVGVTGILSMENAAILANRRAHEVTTATNIARHWQEILRTDGYQWNRPSNRDRNSDLAADTRYLCAVVGCSGMPARADAWFVPTANLPTESAAYDHWARPLALGAPDSKYCVNLRLGWFRQPSINPIDQGVLRAEVRVWWYQEGATRDATYNNCGTGAGLDALGRDVGRVHSVYDVATVWGIPQ
ncbi:MAG: prepilin-type N-terminal cleavage/methylation domain-containing protein [Deltaproteobacteria bacterium]|nr:prepilin-type N-terminal cleavage/methylation domain-containing protein [Deltaproteobacteria bacterium]